MGCVLNLGTKFLQFFKLAVRDVMLDSRIVSLVTRYSVMLAITRPNYEVLLLEGIGEFFIHGGTVSE